MLKKLRTKFVLMTMALITIVLLAVFAATLVSTYQASFDSMHRSLEQAVTKGNRSNPQVGNSFVDSLYLSFGYEPPSGDIESAPFDQKHNDSSGSPDSARNGQDMGAFIPAYVVTVDSNFRIISQANPYVEMDATLVDEAVASVSKRADSEGYLTDLGLYYLRAQAYEGTRIAFADSTNVTDPMIGAVQTSLLIGVCAWLAFLVVSIVLSKIALRPVEEAWNKQSQFVADASHELKTPLTIILANNEILLSAPEKTVQEQKKWVINSQEEAERMERLINNLLQLAQMEQVEAEGTDPATSAAEPVDLSEVAQKCLLQFEAIAFDRNITIESHIESDVVIKGEPDQLEQLIKILVDNACKYAEEGGSITVDLTKEQGSVDLKVINTGSFISDDEAEHIFERFYRSDESRARANGDETAGYGLGLSIAQSIVEAHKGTIKASSSNNETCFEVHLPS